MKRKEGLRILTVLISLFIFLFPAYSCCFSLIETNLSPADVSYENPDQDGSSMNPQSEFRGFAGNVLSISLLHGENLFKLLFDFSYQTFLTDRTPSILRC